MTTCAVKVDYVHLIDCARAHIECHFRRPLIERVLRALLAHTLPYPGRFRAAMILGRLARPLRPLLPRQWQTTLDMIPPHVAPDVLAPQVFRAEGAVQKRVALVAGCAQQTLNGDINAATIRLLQRHGCEVVIAAGSGCCGSLNLHMGREEEARAFARQNIRAWQKVRGGGLDAVVINASGCGTTVKDYGHLFTGEPDMARQAAGAADAIGSGYIESLARPGGNVTGFATMEFSVIGKILETLKQIARELVFLLLVHLLGGIRIRADTQPECLGRMHSGLAWEILW
jgi:glycolate oxidase iron-sulfur subunit